MTNSSRPKPLVLVIHGGAGTDRGMLKLTKRRWNRLADQHGFYVAYPNAVDRLWDFGNGKTSSELEHRVDDLAYFERVIDDIAAKNAIDTDRVFASGISRGGQASYFLACKLPNRIRAVMPVAMGLPEHLRKDCTDGSSVALAVMNGTADPQVPYNGGHTWPSGLPYLPARIVGEVSADIDAADEAWAFFSRF